MNDLTDNAAILPKIQRCILHMGIEKTGTSSIQHFLSMNRSALAKEGVVYPRFTGANGGSQWGFVAAVMDRPWRSDIGARLYIENQADADDYRERLVSAIDDELASHPGTHTMVLSSEHFHSRLSRPELIQSLKDLLSRWTHEFVVIVYFRRQDRVAVSHYSTKLKSGNPNPVVFPPDDASDVPYYYDFAKIYENWTKIFGTGAMVPGLFESEELVDGDLISDFCEKAHLNTQGKRRPPRLNESLNACGIQLLLALNKQWPKAEFSPEDRDRKKLASRISKQNRGKSYPVARREARDFYTRFRESNKKLAEQAFPGRQGPLFRDDFSDYPERISISREKVDKQVRKMIQDWNSAPPSLARKLRSFFSSGSGRPHTSRMGEDKQLPPLFLHVGLPKTATTTLQATLFRHHSQLYYLGGDPDFNQSRGCRSERVYKALKPLFWNHGADYSTRRIRAILLDHLGRVSDKTLLGSWETLTNQDSIAFENMLLNTKAVFGDLRLIFTLRHPLTRIPSLYLQALKVCAKNGRHHSLPPDVVYLSFDDWLYRKRPDGHDYRFGFGDNLRCAVKHLGVDRIGIFLFEDLLEDPEGFYQRIATFLDVDSDEARAQEQKHENPALTVEQVEWLQKINDSQAERKHWLALSAKKRIKHLDSLRLEGSGEKYRVFMNDEQKAYIVRRSHAQNRWIVETFKIDLERHGYPL